MRANSSSSSSSSSSRPTRCIASGFNGIYFDPYLLTVRLLLPPRYVRTFRDTSVAVAATYVRTSNGVAFNGIARSAVNSFESCSARDAVSLSPYIYGERTKILHPPRRERTRTRVEFLTKINVSAKRKTGNTRGEYFASVRLA